MSLARLVHEGNGCYRVEWKRARHPDYPPLDAHELRASATVPAVAYVAPIGWNRGWPWWLALIFLMACSGAPFTAAPRALGHDASAQDAGHDVPEPADAPADAPAERAPATADAPAEAPAVTPADAPADAPSDAPTAPEASPCPGGCQGTGVAGQTCQAGVCACPAGQVECEEEGVPPSLACTPAAPPESPCRCPNAVPPNC